MSEKKSFWKGWWTIPLILLLIFIAWKAYPIIKASEFLKNMGRKE